MELSNYEPCLAGPDIWMRTAVHSNKSEYYDYVLLYVDDALAVSENTKECLLEIDKYFPMKPGSIGEPKIYLGAKISQVQLPNWVIVYTLSTSQYVQESVKNVEQEINKKGLALAKCIKLPFITNYCPELDGGKDLSVDDTIYFSIVNRGIAIDSRDGRMGINMEVSAMSSFVAAPRYGPFFQLLQIFAYLKCHHDARLVFDPSYSEIDDTQFERKDWSGFYGSEKKHVPANSLKPKGKEFIITVYVDASFAGCKLTRISRTGFVVYLNSAPIYWYSKKQGSCEISTFGSDFVALRQ